MSEFDQVLGPQPGRKTSGTLGPQPEGKGTGTQGREDGQGSEGISGGEHVASGHCSPQPAGVVIRATVEHIGLVGDTELTVNVKWPASIFCVHPGRKPPAPPCQASDSQQVPGNGPEASNFQTLYGEAVADPAPYPPAKPPEDELTKLKSELTECRFELAKLKSEAAPASSTSEAGYTGSKPKTK